MNVNKGKEWDKIEGIKTTLSQFESFISNIDFPLLSLRDMNPSPNPPGTANKSIIGIKLLFKFSYNVNI